MVRLLLLPQRVTGGMNPDDLTGDVEVLHLRT